jgi:formylglycine-generating enzyme required for sulfatase activity
MRKRPLVLLATALLVLVAATAARTGARVRERDTHRAHGEQLLRISNPSEEPVVLWRAGPTLDAATPVALPGPDVWLPEANYFVEAGEGPLRRFHPVPLAGFHIGPDTDGTFGLAIRPRADSPPPVTPTGAPWVYVPAGDFALGEAANPGERHHVYEPGFFIGAFEVTNAEFRRFLEDPAGYEDRRHWTARGWAWKATGRSQVTARLAPEAADYRRFGADDLPVVLVTWFEANAYAHWLDQRLGANRWKMRLPTESQWEKAARGPDSFDYGLGTTLSDAEAPLYNWRKNPGVEITLVGWAGSRDGFRANRFGMYHASGNAAEWTQSVSRPFSRDRPFRDDDRNADEGEGLRTTRGGSWYSATTSRLRLAYRERFQPEMSSNDLGFRLIAQPLPWAARRTP